MFTSTPVLAEQLSHPRSTWAEPPAALMRPDVPTVLRAAWLSTCLQLVSARGFEPPRPFGHQLLRLARLPFRHADSLERYCQVIAPSGAFGATSPASGGGNSTPG